MGWTGDSARNAGRNQPGALKLLLQLQKLRTQMFWGFFSIFLVRKLMFNTDTTLID